MAMDGITLAKDTATMEYLGKEIEKVAALKLQYEWYRGKLTATGTASLNSVIGSFSKRYTELQRSYFKVADTHYKVKGE